jgi:hypothetical protein
MLQNSRGNTGKDLISPASSSLNYCALMRAGSFKLAFVIDGEAADMA